MHHRYLPMMTRPPRKSKMLQNNLGLAILYLQYLDPHLGYANDSPYIKLCNNRKIWIQQWQMQNLLSAHL